MKPIKPNTKCSPFLLTEANTAKVREITLKEAKNGRCVSGRLVVNDILTAYFAGVKDGTIKPIGGINV